MNLRDVTTDWVPSTDEERFRRVLAAHHYLGALPKIGETLWYIARWRGRPARFGHPLLLLETFVGPTRLAGTMYRAANWQALGHTRGFRRIQGGYSATPDTPKQVFVRALVANARARLTRPILEPSDRHGAARMMISADHMRSLPEFFADIPDPRRPQGRRHPLSCVLALATPATLSGMVGYKAIGQWVADRSQGARARFRCRYRNGRYEVPGTFTLHDLLIRVDPGALDAALTRHNAVYAEADEALAIDGKTLCNAINDDGRQTHVMSVVGHQSGTTFAQKSRQAAACRRRPRQANH